MFLQWSDVMKCVQAATRGASRSQHAVSPHHDTPSAKKRQCGDIYPDRHLLVEIHLHDKICCLWTQRKRRCYILSPSPLICPQQASKIKSSLYIIHCTEEADRATVERRGEGGGQKREGTQERKEYKRKSQRVWRERERARVIRGTLYQGEDSALLIHQHRQGPRKSMVVKQWANGDVWRPNALLWIS